MVALSSGVGADIATAAERGKWMGWIQAGSLVGPAVRVSSESGTGSAPNVANRSDLSWVASLLNFLDGGGYSGGSMSARSG